MQSEFQALAKCYQLLFCYNLIPEFTKFLPPSIATIRTSLEYARTLFGLLTELLAAGDDAFYKTKPNNSIEKEIKKLLTIEPEVWLEELGHQRLEFPCLVVNIGSGTSGGVVRLIFVFRIFIHYSVIIKYVLLSLWCSCQPSKANTRANVVRNAYLQSHRRHRHHCRRHVYFPCSRAGKLILS